MTAGESLDSAEPAGALGSRPAADTPPPSRRDRSGLVTPLMLGVASGAMLVPLNSTMLAVALPRISAAFAITPTDVASLVTLYLGAVAVTLPASGSLGDRFGHRRTFFVGVLGFGAASLIAALAPSFAVLAVSRLLQAASGSLVSTSSVALIRQTAPPDRSGAAFGVFDMLTSISGAVGPLVGGLIVGAFDWRAMFFVAAPIAVFAFVAVAIQPATPPTATHDAPRRPRPIDAPGLASLALVLVALLVALRGGPTAIPAAVAAVALLSGFLWIEGRSASPAVDPALFRSTTFAVASFGVAGATVVLHGSLVMVPLLIERLDGGSPETSGLALLGISALWAVAAPFGGRWSDRAGRRSAVVAGSAIMTAGLAALWLSAGSASVAVIGLLLAIVGLGMGLSGSPRQVAALETVGRDRVGMAAGTYYTCRYLGGVVGASLAGAALGSQVTPGGVSLGFGALVAVGLAVVVSSFGLTGRVPAATGRS